MTDVNVLAISLEEFTDAGEVLFRSENVYHLDKLGPGEPLIIWLTVEGTIPGWGVSCVDTAGNKKVYSINLSGMDGNNGSQTFYFCFGNDPRSQLHQLLDQRFLRYPDSCILTPVLNGNFTFPSAAYSKTRRSDFCSSS